MPLDAFQKTGLAGLTAVGVLFAGFSGIQMSRNANSVTGPEATVNVHVSGAVKKPGVVRIPAGRVVKDAIDAAGGAHRGADLETINLAEQVEDGMKIEVGNPNTMDTDTPIHSLVSKTETPTSKGTSKANLPAGAISLSNASAAELDTLPGVGPATADKIVAYRNANGPFQTVDDLVKVKGIGPKKMEAIRPFVRP